MNVDERLRAAFTEMSAEVTRDDAAWRSIERSVKRRARSQRMIGALALACVVAASSVIASRLHGTDVPPITPSEAARGWLSHDPEYNSWTFAYPSDWSLAHVGFPGPGTPSFAGSDTAVLATFDLDAHREFDEAGVPIPFAPSRSGVAVEFRNDWTDSGAPSPDPEPEFPVSLDDARPRSDHRHSGDHWREIHVQQDDFTLYSIWIWTGPDAPDEDVSTARDIVASARLARSDDDEIRTYEDRAGGWTIDVPKGWDRQIYEAVGRVSVRATRFSDSPLGPDVEAVPNEWPPRYEEVFMAPPRTAVLVEIFYQAGGPVPFADRPETRFPLSLDSMEDHGLWYHGRTRRGAPIIIDGLHTFTVYAWVGPDAPRASIDILRRVVRSIRFVQE